MTRIKKAGLAAACFLAAAAISAVILATVEISSPRLESALEARAREITGTPFSTGGLSVRLARGLTVRNVSMGGPGEEFLTAEKITIKANLLQLARRKLDIEEIIIEKPVITLGANGFFLPPVLPAEAEDPETGFKFSLQSAEVRYGRLAALKDGMPASLAENIFIRAHADGADKPIKIEAEADIMGAARLEASGTIGPIPEPEINIASSLAVDWAGGHALHPAAGGRGKSVFTVSVSGRPDELHIRASGDMTGEEISFGESFLKPAGLKTSAAGRAFLSYPGLQIELAEAELGNNSLKLEGRLCLKAATAALELTGDIDIEDAVECLPAMKDAKASGSGSLEALLEKAQGSTVRIDGRCDILNWRISAAGGESLNFEFSLAEETLRLRNLRGRIGGGTLSGYGFFSLDGEYEFTIEGVDIDIEKLLQTGQGGERIFGVSGSAGMSASVKSRGRGIALVSGRGMFQAEDGMIKTLPWAERFLAASNMAWVLPLRYDRIRGEFTVQNGLVSAAAALRSEKMHIETDKAEFDLVNSTKQVHADILFPPASIEILRESLGDIRKLLYVDARGYAHVGLVWDGSLSDAAPDIPASLMRTGQKRIRQIFGL